MGRIYTKGEVVDYVWQYSWYYGNLLGYCTQIYENENGHASLIYLFNLVENAFKENLSDYDSNFYSIIDTSYNRGFINEIELNFLNDKTIGVRKIRNLLAHANLSKFNIVFLNENKDLLFPLTENETCLKIYDLFSDILFNLILKIISKNFIIPICVDLNDKINSLSYEIKEFSAEDILKDKGISVDYFIDWEKKSESEKYRIAENSQNVNVLTEIFKHLK